MPTELGEWPHRTWGLAALGAVTGLILHLLMEFGTDPTALQTTIAGFVIVGAMAFGFSVERNRIQPTVIFAVVAGLMVASVTYLNGAPDKWADWEGWRVFAALITIAIAAPLFQAWGDTGMPRPPRFAQLPYPTIHDRAWINVVLWFASWAFTGIVWLLVLLIAQLFGLIGIDALSDLMREEAFIAILTGGAFGAAVGLLRDREKILATLQSVVRRVLAVLAPVLGAGLALFLVSMLFTGLTPLWDATKATTPILISAIIAALVLGNAAIGDSTEDEAKPNLIRWGTMALGAVMLPLAIIAAISTGLRISQYGLTPDRLWAIVFTAIACAYGLAYLVMLVRKRAGWMAGIRASNVKLALGLCVLAFVLSTPLINFGAWSTADQVARLNSSTIKPDEFDWMALRFEFGPSGEAAVKRLAKTGATPAIRTAATDALKITDRWSGAQTQIAEQAANRSDDWLVVRPTKTDVPPELLKALAERQYCGSQASSKCMIVYTPGQTIVFGASLPCDTCSPDSFKLVRTAKGWVPDHEAKAETLPTPQPPNENAAFEQGKIQVRDVPARRVYVDGKPIGQVFAD